MTPAIGMLLFLFVDISKARKGEKYIIASSVLLQKVYFREMKEN